MDTNIKKATQIKEYLQFGMKLSAEIKFGPNDSYNLQCSLVGIKEGQYMVLDMAQKAVEDLITRRTNNARIVVRGITDTELGEIIAFTTEIVSIVSRPTWLIFIKFPYNFETKAIRSNRRMKVNLPIIVSHDDEEHKATLRDLSLSGCGIYIKKRLDLEKEQHITFRTNLENFPEQLPACIVVNLRKYAGETVLGIRFESDIEITDQLRYELLDKGIFNFG